MDIYLIRHGETIHNKSKVHQYPTTPLSERGEQQAVKLAERLKAAKIDKIYASPLKRAQQTATIISEKSDLSFTTLDDLREIKNPSLFEGRSHADPELVDAKASILQHFHEETWHHSDEENFFNVYQRARELLKKLEQEKVEDVLLVSHGHFIAMTVSTILLQENLSPQIFLSLKARIVLNNTGITHCRYTASSGWQVITLNDTTHLS